MEKVIPLWVAINPFKISNIIQWSVEKSWTFRRLKSPICPLVVKLSYPSSSRVHEFKLPIKNNWNYMYVPRLIFKDMY